MSDRQRTLPQAFGSRGSALVSYSLMGKPLQLLGGEPVIRHVGRKIAPETSIGVLNSTLLPGAPRIAKVAPHCQALVQGGVNGSARALHAACAQLSESSVDCKRYRTSKGRRLRSFASSSTNIAILRDRIPLTGCTA